jgi:hypothetical protein
VLHMYLAALLLRAGALVDPHGPAGRPWWPHVVVTVRVLNAFLGMATVALLTVLAAVRLARRASGRRPLGVRPGLDQRRPLPPLGRGGDAPGPPQDLAAPALPPGAVLGIFRVRGTRAGSGPVAKLEIVRHLPGRGYDLVAAREWIPRI